MNVEATYTPHGKTNLRDCYAACKYFFNAVRAADDNTSVTCLKEDVKFKEWDNPKDGAPVCSCALIMTVYIKQ